MEVETPMLVANAGGAQQDRSRRISMPERRSEASYFSGAVPEETDRWRS